MIEPLHVKALAVCALAAILTKHGRRTTRRFSATSQPSIESEDQTRSIPAASLAAAPSPSPVSPSHFFDNSPCIVSKDVTFRPSIGDLEATLPVFGQCYWDP